MTRNIALATLYTVELARMAALTNPSKSEYCERWGYRFECHVGTLDEARPPAWSKILHVRDLLDRYDWVFWLDADAIITNGGTSLDDLLDDRYNVILAKQPGPDPFGNLHLNTGSFFIKSDAWSMRFLDDIYQQTRFIDHPCWEQEAFMNLYRERADVRERVKVEVNARRFNAIANSYVKGDFVFHAINPNRTEQGKIKLIEQTLEDDRRIPGEVEPELAIGVIFHDEEEENLLEFTLPSLLTDNAGTERNALHLIKAFESSFGNDFGWEHSNRHWLHRALDLLDRATQDVVAIVRPRTFFFSGWRRRLLVALGACDLSLATDVDGARVCDDVILLRNNARCREFLLQCKETFEAFAPGQRDGADVIRSLLADMLSRIESASGLSWTRFPVDVVHVGSPDGTPALDMIGKAAFSPGFISNELQRSQLRQMQSSINAVSDRLRQTIIES